MMNLDELARWAYQAGKEAEVPAPLAIHGNDYSNGAHDWRVRTGELIGGKPFSRTFARYVDGSHKAMTPIRRAIQRMRSPRGAQTLEFRICWAIVECGYVLGDIPELSRADPAYLRPFALRGLSLLYDLTQREKADEPERKPFKPEGGPDTVPTKGTRSLNGPRRGQSTARRLADSRGISGAVVPRPAA